MPNNYVDGFYDYKKEQVLVWEKTEDQRIIINRYPAPYYFYVEDSKGTFTGMDDKKLKKLTFKNRKEFEAARKQYRVKYESDINPLEKVLMDNYYNIPVPQLNTVFIDIENDYKTFVYSVDTLVQIRNKNNINNTSNITVGELRTTLDLDNFEVYDTRQNKWILCAICDHLYEGEVGYSNTTNPYAPINAITLYNTLTKKYFTVAIANREWQYYGWGIDKVKEDDKYNLLDLCDLHIVNTERELLLLMIAQIKKGDVISGWNSDFFDYPYIIQRISETLGDEYLTQMYYDFAPKPVLKETRNRFGEDALIVNGAGKIHLDYMQVFKKFVAGGRSSWALAAIAAEELEDLDKLTYDGDLEGLYNSDFMFFIRYNIRDVEIMVGLEKKYKFSRLANELAHNNTVRVEKVLGTVTMVDCGIINYAHYERNVIVNDKKEAPKIKIEGGLVLVPKIGLHEWVGSVDLNALYPTMKRSLNISPEKLVGQFKEFEHAWYAIQENSLEKLTFVYEKDFKEITKSAVEWKQYFINNKMSISAYGTAFDQGNGVGIIPGLLSQWQIKRKENQALEKKYEKLLAVATEQNNKQDMILYQDLFETHYIAQQGYKLSSNSLYGAVINEHDKFYDYRLGGSTTASGRRVTNYMMSKVCEAHTGKLINTVRNVEIVDDEEEVNYTHVDQNLIYGDTDSVAGDSVVIINDTRMTIEDAFTFLKGETHIKNSDTQTKYLNYIDYVTPCYTQNKIEQKKIASIYRHKVKKKKFKIVTENNKEVIVTEDHSIMVKRNNILIEVKPLDILLTDIIITIK